MRRTLHLLGLLVAVAATVPAPSRPAAAEVPLPPPPDETVREIFVPFDDLNVLLEGAPERVLLSRSEFADLLAKARKTAETHPPLAATLVSADYDARLADERAVLTGRLVVDVLDDGLHTVGLDVAGVGLRRATLDDREASLGLADDGRLLLFVEGKGRHTLVLEMVAPLQASTARQVLNLCLPTPPAARLHLVAPGDVEVKSGAPVVSRTFEAASVPGATGQTRIEVLPRRGQLSLVMSLNSHLQRKDRVVVARSVFVDEVTQAFERLHATVSFGVLHRAVDEFRFALPAGFEVTDVRTPLLARWAVHEEDGRRILQVFLREETADTVVLNLSAVRTGPVPEGGWTLPHLEPLDVVGQVAVVGLLLEDRLKGESIAPEGLIPIDTAVLARALPPTVLQAEPGAAPVRPLVAYYAPQPTYALSARFVKPPAQLLVTTNLLLVLDDGGQRVRGGFAMIPEEEKLFAFDFSVPAGWDVTAVTTDQGAPLAFERYGAAGQAARIRVRMAEGVPAGQECRVYFEAQSVPVGWFGEWMAAEATFPVFAVAGARRDTGAIAVDARDDLTVRPKTLDRLIPLDENEKAKYGLEGVSARLAYRYEGQPYAADLSIGRTSPRLTARTHSFFRLERQALVAHYEITYDVAEARTQRLAFLLPASTPIALAIRGLDGVAVKEYTSEAVTRKGADAKDVAMRRWTVLLAERRRGTVRLAVDFTDRYAGAESKGLALPVVCADGVAYQSGLVAVEGSAELDVVVRDHPRKVDIGELVDAEYQPGRRLLGAFGFVGDAAPVTVDVSPCAEYALPPAIVQRAELVTALSAPGRSQTAARFLLRTKDLFLEVRLPEGSTLWAATLDGKPVKPQREGDRLLLSLPAAAEGTVRDLQLAYETPVGAMGFWRQVGVPAPRLFLRATRGGEGREVPAADLQWNLYLPKGYEVVRSEGSVDTSEVQPPSLAATQLLGVLGSAGGGVNLRRGVLGLASAIVPRREDEKIYYLPPATAEESPPMPLGGGEVGNLAIREKLDRSSDDSYIIHDSDSSEVRLGTALVRGTHPNAPAPSSAPTPAQNMPVKRSETKASQYRWALEGVGSLKIDVAPEGDGVAFRSLGRDARLDLTVVHRPRLRILAVALALAVVLGGVALTRRSAGRKVLYLLAVGLVATLVPVVTGRIELALVLNASFYAACLLVLYYLAVVVVRWSVRCGRRLVAVFVPRLATCLLAAGLVAVAASAASADGAAPTAAERISVEVVDAGPPPKIPEDALILPFDPDSKTGVRDASKVLVPYARFLELWNLAHPDARLSASPPPAPYALAGARYAASLAADDFLLVEGSLDVDVFADGHVAVPLPLAGGVLAKADLDGKPARLQVIAPVPTSVNVSQSDANVQQTSGPSPTTPGLVVLYVSGKGRHHLDVAVRLRLDRRGGWRVADGRVPAAAATALTLRVPAARTEIRLGGILDRQFYDVASGEPIQTALGPDGALSVQWRPKVAEAQVDQALTASSTAVFDIEEDRLRLVWSVGLEFRRTERDAFSFEIPEGYLVEKVEGANVRGWEVRPPADGAATGPRLEIVLLKQAKDRESFTVSLWHPLSTPSAQPARISVPVLGVTGAALHSGLVVLRRSPLLDVQTVETSGVTRIDLPSEIVRAAADDSPLGLRPYQAFRFASVPFVVAMSASPVPVHATARVQTILRLADREVGLESRAVLSVRDRPLYRVRLVVPADLRIDQVFAPGRFEWAATEEGGRRLLTVYLATGCQGDVPVVVRGVLGNRPDAGPEAAPRDPTGAVDVPRIEVLDVSEQQGDVVVQADPVFEVRVDGLRNLDRAFLGAMGSWLSEPQRRSAKLALHYADPDYAGRLTLVAKTPDVSCYTVTNVRVTDRALEETILLDFTVREAGVREVTFLLPWWMKDARIDVPLLRQKTVEPTGSGPQAPWRVRLELQDEVMDQLRVLVQNDRLLEESAQQAPVPVVETGRTDRRYVALESAGRDEVVVTRREGLEPLDRRQKEWQAVEPLFRGGTTQAYLVAADARDVALEFQTRRRAAVETTTARIGLAQTLLVLDTEGAYVAAQVYHVDNRTEQFLEIEMPEGAALWTARVADEPVKPATVPGADRRLRIPLVKTAAGDLDYTVVLKYGGRLPRLESLRTVAFPVVRTCNVGIDLSQVELYLPESHAWCNFDGTMRRVAEEGDFEAGVVSYQNRQAERLVQAIRSSDNPFAQARAVTNLGTFSTELTRRQAASAERYHGNQKVQDELAAGRELLRDADQQVRASEKAPQVVTGNEDALRGYFSGQQNRRARNVLSDLGANWSGSDVAATSPSEEGDVVGFELKWAARNNLEAAKPSTGEGHMGDVDGSDGVVASEKGRFANGHIAKGAPSAPQVFFGDAAAKDEKGGWQYKLEVREKQKPLEETAAQTADDLAQRYQQKLEKRSQIDRVVTAGTDWTIERRKGDADGRRAGIEGVGFFGGVAGDGGGGGEGAFDAVVLTGQASLDVELAPRGRLYRFTTTGGEVSLTARPVSRRLVASLVRLAGVLVAVGVMMLVRRLVKRGGLAPSAQPAAATILIVLAAAGLMFGVFQIASLVVLGVAIVWRIHLAIRRRRAAMAA